MIIYRNIANSANTNDRPFQAKINCSKFVNRWNSTTASNDLLLVSLSVASRNLLFGVFLPWKIITILRKMIELR